MPPKALENLGATEYDVALNPDEFAGYLGNSYDLIVIDHSNYGGADVMLDALAGYVENGGRLVIASWRLYESSPLWPLLGYSNVTNGDVVPIYQWQPSHAVFTFPNAVPNLTAMTDGGGTDNFPGNALDNAEAVAGITSVPAVDSASIFVNDTGRTVLNAFLMCNAISDQLVPNDIDDDGKPDATELWENEIVSVMQGDVQPVLLPNLQPAMTKSSGAQNNSR